MKRRDPPPSAAAPAVAPWIPAAAGLIFFAFYAVLAPAVAGDKDTGEFALVLATFGLAHPTGYPLYTLAGGAFVHAAHALGASWAHAANLFSALGAGVAMGGLHALAVRLLAPSTGARAAGVLAFLPLLAMGFNPMWTVEATLAEVNSWHLAWVALAGLAALSIARALERGGRRAAHGAFLWGVVVGAGLAHHLTSVLFAAPLTLALAWVAWRGPRRGVVTLVAAWVAGALVPLSSLAYVAWRAWNPAAVQWPTLEAHWPAVVDHVTGAQYRTFLGRFAPSDAQRAHLGSYVFPWLAPAAAGAVAAFAGRGPAADRAWRTALAAGVLLQVAYAFFYGVRDPATYFLPALAIGLALFVAGAARVPVLRRRRQGRAVALVAALGLIVPAVGGVRTARARNEALARFDTLLRQMWAALPPGPAFVVWDDDMASRLRAFQVLERSRPEVEVVQPRHLTHPVPRRHFAARHGFDPAAGIAPGELDAVGRDESRSASLVDAIAGRINASSPTPVVLFLPAVPSMRQLEKPEQSDAAR